MTRKVRTAPNTFPTFKIAITAGDLYVLKPEERCVYRARIRQLH